MGQRASLREYRPEDAAALGSVAVAAFAAFAPRYADWPDMAANLAAMPTLAKTGELIIAQYDGRLAGGVAYVPAGRPKPAFFDPAWAIMRMLVVHPEACGRYREVRKWYARDRGRSTVEEIVAMIEEAGTRK